MPQEYEDGFVNGVLSQEPTVTRQLERIADLTVTIDTLIDDWLNENVPERYHYQLGPDGTPQDAFAALCKDALQAMPGNQQRLRLEGARHMALKLRGWLATGGNEKVANVLAAMEHEGPKL